MTQLIFLLALALQPEASAAAPPALAPDPTTLEGVVVSAGAGKLAMKDEQGKEHSYMVEPGTKITVHGKPGKLEDLKLGMKIKVMTDAVNKLLTVATVDDAKLRM